MPRPISGYAAADRHFSQARMNPDILMVDADHDMRNPADMLVLDRVARNVIHIRGYRDGPGHHPAAGNSDPAQLDPVPNQHAGPDHQHEPAVPARPIRQQLKMVDEMNASIDIMEQHVRA